VRWRGDGLLRDQASSFVGTPARLPTQDLLTVIVEGRKRRRNC
jgi:hypothetical protein